MPAPRKKKWNALDKKLAKEFLWESNSVIRKFETAYKSIPLIIAYFPWKWFKFSYKTQFKVVSRVNFSYSYGFDSKKQVAKIIKILKNVSLNILRIIAFIYWALLQRSIENLTEFDRKKLFFTISHDPLVSWSGVCSLFSFVVFLAQ